jgi:hypothetical protein
MHSCSPHLDVRSPKEIRHGDQLREQWFDITDGKRCRPFDGIGRILKRTNKARDCFVVPRTCHPAQGLRCRSTNRRSGIAQER